MALHAMTAKFARCAWCGMAIDGWKGTKRPRYCNHACLSASQRKDVPSGCVRCGRLMPRAGLTCSSCLSNE